MVGCGNRNIIETQRLKWQSCSGKFCFPHTFSTFSWGKSPKLRSESFLDECGIVIQIEFSRLTTVQNKECFTWIKTCIKSLEISLEFVIEEAPFQKYVDVRVQHAIQNKKLSSEGKFVELTVQSYSSAFFKKLWVFLGSKTTLRCTSCLLPTGLFGCGSQV